MVTTTENKEEIGNGYENKNGNVILLESAKETNGKGMATEMSSHFHKIETFANMWCHGDAWLSNYFCESDPINLIPTHCSTNPISLFAHDSDIL